MNSSADSIAKNATLAVLAGGLGSRMGIPKGRLIIDRKPILERLIDRLRWPGPTLLVTAPGFEKPPGSGGFGREVTDPVAGEGPLRGLDTALRAVETPLLILIPVDMPLITAHALATMVNWLIARPELTGIMLKRREGDDWRIEPMPLVLRVERASRLIEQQMERGFKALHRLADQAEISLEPVPGDWPTDFWTNLNNPADLAGLSDGYERK